MYGVIERQHLCEDEFKKIEGLKEVYASDTFSFYQNNPELVFYVDRLTSTVDTFMNLCKIFGDIVSVRRVTTPDNILLQGKRIIWKSGQWYL